jgi:hypothetical protein
VVLLDLLEEDDGKGVGGPNVWEKQTWQQNLFGLKHYE